ncbi:MAG: hypothetical protein IPK10_03405 [Bacteroidetes bacterium]|nr:hypothetical protein [Bacteroidota bacterium]
MDEHEMKVEVVEGKGKDGKTIKKRSDRKVRDQKREIRSGKWCFISADGSTPPVPLRLLFHQV